MSSNCWMDKQIMVYSYNGTLLSNKKELSTDIHNISGSQNHYAVSKKPDSKEHIMSESNYKILKICKLMHNIWK